MITVRVFSIYIFLSPKCLQKGQVQRFVAVTQMEQCNKVLDGGAAAEVGGGVGGESLCQGCSRGQCWLSLQTNSCLIDSPSCDNKQHTTNQKYNPINMSFEQTAIFLASRSAALSYLFLHYSI